MQSAVGYLRVSTREQGRSGLGLAAQRRDIEVFGAREGFSIKSWLSGYPNRRWSRCVAYASRARGCTERGACLPVSADSLKTRPLVSQRTFHFRADGASSAFHGCSSRKGLRRIHVAYLCLARRAGTKVDLAAMQSCDVGSEASRKEIWGAVALEGVATTNQDNGKSSVGKACGRASGSPKSSH